MAASLCSPPSARPCAVAPSRQQAPQAAAPCQLQRNARATGARRRNQQLVLAVAAPVATANGSSSSNGAGPAAGAMPTDAETARTIVDLVAHGTLCTISEDGIPLGTYVSYVLDDAGQPILRLRADAVHTANLKRDPKCSLFVQPGEHPARLLARVTLIGSVEPVSAGVLVQGGSLRPCCGLFAAQQSCMLM